MDGMLHLCLQTPRHLPSRMLLLHSMRKLGKRHPELAEAIKPKVEYLLEEYPIEEVQEELEDELRGAAVSGQP